MTNEVATAKHTPGPWEAIQTSSNRCTTEVNREYSTRFIIIPADGPVLARVYCDDDRNPAAANARLIAAAPELLEALRELSSWLEHMRDKGTLSMTGGGEALIMGGILHDAETVIARAEGRA